MKLKDLIARLQAIETAKSGRDVSFKHSIFASGRRATRQIHLAEITDDSEKCDLTFIDRHEDIQKCMELAERLRNQEK